MAWSFLIDNDRPFSYGEFNIGALYKTTESIQRCSELGARGSLAVSQPNRDSLVRRSFRRRRVMSKKWKVKGEFPIYRFTHSPTHLFASVPYAYLPIACLSAIALAAADCLFLTQHSEDR
jgi:hypothetical protein